jgi:hypothetical protein
MAVARHILKSRRVQNSGSGIREALAQICAKNQRREADEEEHADAIPQKGLRFHHRALQAVE